MRVKIKTGKRDVCYMKIKNVMFVVKGNVKLTIPSHRQEKI